MGGLIKKLSRQQINSFILTDRIRDLTGLMFEIPLAFPFFLFVLS